MLHERSWNTGKRFIHLSIGIFCFSAKQRDLGTFCRLAMSHVIPTVSRDSSKDGECSWDFTGSRLSSEAQGEAKEYRTEEESFRWPSQQLPPSLFLWGQTDSCFCLSFSPFFLPVLSRGHLSLLLCVLHLLTTHQILRWNLPNLTSPAVKTHPFIPFQKSL